jgi:acyl carrier protein
VAGLIKAVLALHHKVLPPTIHVRSPLKPLTATATPFYVNTSARPWFAAKDHPRRAGVSAFGFGGSNFHCLLEEATEVKMPFETGAHLAAVSAESSDSLISSLERLKDEVRLQTAEGLSDLKDPNQNISDGYSQALDSILRPLAGAFDPKSKVKLFMAFPSERARDFMESLPQLLKGGSAPFALPEGLFFGKEAASESVFYDPGTLPLLPWEGAGLSLDFSHHQMIMDLFGLAWEGAPLGLLLTPPELLNEELKGHLLRELSEISTAYFLGPALSLALFELYTFFGVRMSYVSGSGYGLITALIIAGFLPLKDLVKVLAKLGPGASLLKMESAIKSLSLKAPRGFIGPKLLAPDGFPLTRIGDTRDLLISELRSAYESFSPDIMEVDRKDLLDAKASQDSLEGTLAQASQEELSRSSEPLRVQKLFPSKAVIASGSLRTYPKDGHPESYPWLLEAPKNPLELATNLAKLASFGQDVQFRNWSFHSFPQQKPQGHAVPLGGANLFSARNNAVVSLSGKLPGTSVRAQDAAPGDTTPIVQPSVSSVNLELNSLSARLEELSRVQEKTLLLLDSLMNSKDLKAPQAPGSPLLPVRPNPRSLGSAQNPQKALNSQNSGRDSISSREPRPEDILIRPSETVSTLPIQNPAASPLQNQTNASYLESSSIADPDSFPVSSDGDFSPVPLSTVTASYPNMSVPPTRGEIWEAVSDIVSRETGYPTSSLHPGMDLEVDLGLDSIRKVELLAELVNAFPQADGPADGATLGDFCLRIEQAFNASYKQECVQPQKLRGDLSQEILTLISRETGYPNQSLHRSFSLEADLGLDSIKKVEILAMLGEEFPEIMGSDLSKAETIGDILDMAQAMIQNPSHNAQSANYQAPLASPETQTPPRIETKTPSTPKPPTPLKTIDTERLVTELLSRETGYPQATLLPHLELEGDLGLDSIKKVEVLSCLTEEAKAQGIFSEVNEESQKKLSDSQTLGEWMEFFRELAAGANFAPDASVKANIANTNAANTNAANTNAANINAANTNAANINASSNANTSAHANTLAQANTSGNTPGPEGLGAFPQASHAASHAAEAFAQNFSDAYSSEASDAYSPDPPDVFRNKEDNNLESPNLEAFNTSSQNPTPSNSYSPALPLKDKPQED